MEDTQKKVWVGRLFVGLVLMMNVLAAVQFLWRPEAYVLGFELSGVVGSAAIRGIGVLFLMWNVPYFVAVLHPVKQRVSLYESVAMQSIGVVGESLIYLSLPAGFFTLHNSILRFIIFDSLGLMLLVLAVWVTHTSEVQPANASHSSA